MKIDLPSTDTGVGPKVTDFSKNENNPFIEKAITDIQITKKYRAQGASRQAILSVVDSEGEVQGHTMFLREIKVDEQRFTKMYLSKFESFWDLPKSAVRVFGYVMSKLRPKSDKFDFSMPECQKHTKYKTPRSVYEGLAALLAAGIIARGPHEYIYFINPMVCFNGDRVSYVETYVKDKADKVKKVVTKNENQLALL